MSHVPISASLARDEAVLRFPYDDRLRMLLRAIPGRRWDPVDRAWCVPLDPDQAQALALLFDGLPTAPDVSPELDRAIARRRAKRQRRELLLDVARPDSDWWLSFATDAAPESVSALLEHPEAREVPEIGRALVPIDDHAAELLDGLDQKGAGVRFSDLARRALHTHAEGARRGPGDAGAASSHTGGGTDSATYTRHDVELRRDRRGEHWILIAGAPRAARTRRSPPPPACACADGPGGSVGLAAVERRRGAARRAARPPRGRRRRPARQRVARARDAPGTATIEVDGPGEEPGVRAARRHASACRAALRERAASAPGGASRAADARLLAPDRTAQLDGWISRAAKRCVDALLAGRPAPARRARVLLHPRRAHVRARARPRRVAARARSPRSRGVLPRPAAVAARARALAAPADPRRPVLRARARRVPRRREPSGSRPTRSRCCRRSASSTHAPPGLVALSAADRRRARACRDWAAS